MPDLPVREFDNSRQRSFDPATRIKIGIFRGENRDDKMEITGEGSVGYVPNAAYRP